MKILHFTSIIFLLITIASCSNNTNENTNTSNDITEEILSDSDIISIKNIQEEKNIVPNQVIIWDNSSLVKWKVNDNLEKTILKIEQVITDQKLAKQNHEYYKWKTIKDIIKDIKREERKDVCIELINRNKIKNPVLAYTSANCLLYNWYWELAIPFFVEFLINWNNKKYLNDRMWYDWLHSADWYWVWGDILSDMTWWEWMYEWVISEMNKKMKIYLKASENHTFDDKFINTMATMVFKSELKKISKEELTNTEMSVKNCNNTIINIEDYKCDIDLSNKKLHNCKIWNIWKKMVECWDNL